MGLLVTKIAYGYGNEFLMEFVSLFSKLRRSWCQRHRQNITNELALFSQRSDEKCGCRRFLTS